MGEIWARISQIHRSKLIQSLAFEGATFADEDSYSDWLTRSGGLPQIVAKIVPMVQVYIDYMGERKQMNVRVGTPKNEFLSLAKAFLGTTHNLDAFLLGSDDWEIRAGHTYDIRETRILTLKCKNTDNRDFTIKIQGTKEITDVQKACRQR
jgi:hypothetical protein